MKIKLRLTKNQYEGRLYKHKIISSFSPYTIKYMRIAQLPKATDIIQMGKVAYQVLSTLYNLREKVIVVNLELKGNVTEYIRFAVFHKNKIKDIQNEKMEKT